MSFTRYGYQGVSSCLRTYQYESLLGVAGFDVDANSLLNDKYVSELNFGRRDWAEIASGYVGRGGTRERASRAKVIYVEKEFFPKMPFSRKSTFYRSRNRSCSILMTGCAAHSFTPVMFDETQ